MKALETDRRDKLALVSEQAAEWFIRLKDDGLTGPEQEEYLLWLKSSPDHIAEALRMGQTFACARRAGLWGPTSDEEVSNVVALSSKEQVVPAPRSLSGQRHSRWWPWAIAAVLPALALGALLLVARHIGWLDAAIETQASEWRHFTLADGSIVRTGPRTRLRIHFDDNERLIRLLEGEALFQVAKDPARPFFIDADTAVVRATGTEFGVWRTSGRLLVTVAEGVVAVSRPLSQSTWFRDRRRHEVDAPQSVAVLAGQQAAVLPTGPVTVRRVNASNELAWANGQLIFENTTVMEAIGEFNRRNRIQIVLEDSAIASRAVRGVFGADDPESFALVLARQARASIDRDKPGVLLLKPLGEHQEVDAQLSPSETPESR